jgi:hypothetical protein
MQRKLRVWPELPPRHSRGADSSSITLHPASRAIRAAHRAALPPPITKTSKVINTLNSNQHGAGTTTAKSLSKRTRQKWCLHQTPDVSNHNPATHKMGGWVSKLSVGFNKFDG